MLTGEEAVEKQQKRGRVEGRGAAAMLATGPAGVQGQVQGPRLGCQVQKLGLDHKSRQE